MKRVYHPYTEWEEIKYNMWGTVEDKKLWLKKAIEFTGDYKLYGRWMMKVIDNWPISCENALTDNSINRRAWIGHAAVAYAIQCPENIVREAWSKLTDEQQLLANKKADRAIKVWEYNYLKSKGVYRDMGGEMLF
jgi:hypothetical protein